MLNLCSCEDEVNVSVPFCLAYRSAAFKGRRSVMRGMYYLFQFVFSEYYVMVCVFGYRDSIEFPAQTRAMYPGSLTNMVGEAMVSIPLPRR